MKWLGGVVDGSKVGPLLFSGLARDALHGVHRLRLPPDAALGVAVAVTVPADGLVPPRVPELDVEPPVSLETAAEKPSCPPGPPPAAPFKYAVIVAHGMGQQTKFETLATATQGLVKAAGPALAGPPRVRLVTLGQERYQRVELTLRGDGGPRELHLYEAYWAPLTEGAVTLRDVIFLMFTAGWNGVRNGTGTFRRWLFGRYERLVPPVRSIIYLLAGLLLVLALVVINATIAVVAVARWALGAKPPGLGDGLYGDLSTVFDGLLLAMLAFAFFLWLAKSARGQPPILRLALGGFTFAFFWLALVATVASGVAVPLLFHLHWQDLPPEDYPLLPALLGYTAVEWFNATFELLVLLLLALAVAVVTLGVLLRILSAIWREVAGPTPGSGKTASVLSFLFFFCFVVLLILEVLWLALGAGRIVARESIPAAGRTAVWLLLIGASAVVRRTLVQYLGDIVAYVQPHTLDRFDALRDRIKQTVWKQAQAVYGATRADGKFEYAKVAMVGHSLGSVVVYDALNRLINDDAMSGGRRLMAGNPGPRSLEVINRTFLLLTFGSPLDKTAFVFASQGPESETKLALAATVQPLIERPEYRSFPWVNVYSRWDPISGRLHNYDPTAPAAPGQRPAPVENVRDPGATTFLLAHLEYWESDLIYETLLDRLPSPSERAWRGSERTSCSHANGPVARGTTGLPRIEQNREG